MISATYYNLRRLGNPEVRIPNPCAAGPIPAGGTTILSSISKG